MAKSKSTQPERHQRYRERMQAKGLVQVTDWVPADERERFRELAKQLREWHQQRGEAPDVHPVCTGDGGEQ